MGISYVITITSFLFLIYYFLFYAFQSTFRFPPNIDTELLNPFVVNLVGNKGLELYILFTGTGLFLLLSYILIANHKKLSIFKKKIVQLTLIAPIFLKIVTTNPRKITAISDNLLVLILFLIFMSILIFAIYRFHSRFKLILVLIAWLIFTLFVILTTPTFSGSTYDPNFFIAPAWKLINGEKLGSFYIQYPLGEIFLFELFLKLGMKLHQMQIVLATIFSFWYLLYYFLAKKIIKDKSFVLLFLLSLVLFRFLASPYHPMLSPQGSTMRLDLWVPLFLSAIYFGILSPITSLAFSLAYVFDNFFGLLYLFVYLSTIFVLTLFKKMNLKLKNIILILAPIFASLIFQHYFFHSFLSPSAKLVDDLNYWQMNIHPHSMFWVSILILPMFIFVTAIENAEREKENYLLLLGLAFVGFIYFFGRSHENNLMTTSGILLIILFVTFDKLSAKYNLKRTLFIIASAFIMIICFVFSSNIFMQLNTVYTHLRRGILVDENPIDNNIDTNKNFLNNYKTRKVYFISPYDAYLSYRYNLKIAGYYSPFVANLFKHDTIDLIKNLYDDGYLILVEDSRRHIVENYNQSKFLKDKKLQFDLIEGPSLADIKFYELKINSR